MSKRYPQAVLVSCEVPWDENGELIEPVFRAEVRHTISSGFRDLYIFGTAGEGYAVTLTQFREIAGIFREETTREGVRPMVGVIGMSTPRWWRRSARPTTSGSAHSKSRCRPGGS